MKKRNLFKLAALTAVFALGSMFANAQITDASNDTLHRNTDDTKVVKLIDNKGTVKYIQSMNGITQITSTVANNQTTTTLQLGGQLTTDTYIDVNGSMFGFKGLDTVGNSAGIQLIVTDPDGTIHRMDLTSLIQSGQQLFKTTADDEVTFTTSSLIVLPSFEKVYVYRNGAKLIANVDYTITGDHVITLHPSNANENFKIYKDDRIEVHFVK